MLNKSDLRDFVEINRGLYGDDASAAALGEMLNRMLAALDLDQHQHRGSEHG